MLTNWSAGPSAAGSSTYIGRVETPRVGQVVNTGNGLLVSGWAADLTAQGWAGIDAVEVWAGDKSSGGTKLGNATVGLPRPDIAEIAGSNFTNSGFSGVIPTSAWANLPAGNVELRLYIHTPSKGWWYRATRVTSIQPPTLPYPNDPVVYIAKPQEGMNITQRQLNNKITFSGVALDRNPLSAVQNSLSILPPGIGQSLRAAARPASAPPAISTRSSAARASTPSPPTSTRRRSLATTARSAFSAPRAGPAPRASPSWSRQGLLNIVRQAAGFDHHRLFRSAGFGRSAAVPLRRLGDLDEPGAAVARAAHAVCHGPLDGDGQDVDVEGRVQHPAVHQLEPEDPALNPRR